jgi:pyruvate,water dikinase
VTWWSKLLRRRSEADLVEGLRHKLDRFRDLVDNNNRVLELIAEGGEMAGGEYIFDIQNLRTLAGDLRSAAAKVVLDLDAITGGRYPRLGEATKKIGSEVQAAVEERLVVPRAAYVISIADLDEDQADVAGAKMARLGAVARRVECRVPAGFVVSTFACQRLLAKIGAEREIEAWAACADPLPDAELVRRSAVLQELILRGRVPRDIARAIEARVGEMVGAARAPSLAVRSSALGEDSELSFAGQFLTVLGVAPGSVLEAYRRVVASLFTAEAMRYRQSHGLYPARGLMAVGCLEMIRARAGGVVYTLDPEEPGRDVLVASVTHGLAKTVVDGSGAVDRVEISRDPPHTVVARHLARKDRRYEVAPDGAVRQVEVPASERERSPVSDPDLKTLAETALRIERYLKSAADIEWVLDEDGELVVLQARPLRVVSPEALRARDLRGVASRHRVLLRHKGTIACRGIGFGRVHIVADEEALASVPRDAVVVARTASPKLAAAITSASAVITDVGSTTGHLATIAREFRVPAIVDAEGATEILKDAAEVTVDAEENAVYEGRVPELLRHQLIRSSSPGDTREFRILRRLLRSAAPLNLRDPTSSSFSPESCSTYHDVIRFAHEKAVQELTEGHSIRPTGSTQFVRRLQLPIPLDLLVIDLGGGLRTPEGSRTVTPDCVESRPLRALLEGVLTEGVWALEPAAMDPNAFMASATRAALLTGPDALRPEQNLAIVSAEYLNLNLRLGYHFNIVDCFLSQKRDENYIYFRFNGGVTELARRSRRAELLKRILERDGFVVECSGDLVVARLRKAAASMVFDRMRMIGRLVGFTRQLDVFLGSEELVTRHVNYFLEGKFGSHG